MDGEGGIGVYIFTEIQRRGLLAEETVASLAIREAPGHGHWRNGQMPILCDGDNSLKSN